jgi:hypothetical protein
MKIFLDPRRRMGRKSFVDLAAGVEGKLAAILGASASGPERREVVGRKADGSLRMEYARPHDVQGRPRPRPSCGMPTAGGPSRPCASPKRCRLLFELNPAMWVFDNETLAFLAVSDAAWHYGYSRENFSR